MYHALRPLLFKLDAEAAHGLTLRGADIAQRTGLSRLVAGPPRHCPVHAFGIDFPNPVGLAAGLDKNAAHLDALAAFGFGFIEVGTVTPRPQSGNPRPRLFRLPRHQAVINRMGFNNDGIDVLVRNVEQAAYTGVLGINIGKNKDTPNEQAVDDYLLCLERAWPLASYIVVNISSPNTKGLRDLQQGDTLRRFIGTLRDAQEKLAARHGKHKPMLLKIAPDLDASQMDAIAEVLVEAHVDGVICTNTTIARTGVGNAPHVDESGGLSGAPLFKQATDVLQGMTARLDGRVGIVGVGGIVQGDQAAQKIRAGASLVQIYSGLVYRGPRLVAECVEAIARLEDSAA
ncbi:MAG TPA: quinone-dependent dihydroorotate dehydrogenase [Oleiagrimonas sp.]|nr:quinone-dependent dihydroorotate dehydrogenase [Oleiagrimonas sp.]